LLFPDGAANSKMEHGKSYLVKMRLVVFPSADSFADLVATNILGT
jgi:hypothetical protein